MIAITLFGIAVRFRVFLLLCRRRPNKEEPEMLGRRVGPPTWAGLDVRSRIRISAPDPDFTTSDASPFNQLPLSTDDIKASG